MNLKLNEHTHHRYNILSGEWILVSPHRAERPWSGQEEKVVEQKLPEFDSACYLCPGNERANGISNPEYDSVYSFTNDFPALFPDTSLDEFNSDNLLIARGESGTCKVICFSPQHNVTLPELSVEQIQKVVDIWTEEYRTFASDPNINYVQIFENKGEAMGCSNPHPHSQIWAQNSIPSEPAKEFIQFTNYYSEKFKCLLCDYLSLEQKLRERLICDNEDFIALVPFWAVWPFETIILSKRHFGSLLELKEKEKKSYADILKRLMTKYDNLFTVSFPYSAGVHQSPTDKNEHPEWHFHMHFYPPLLRSATVKKFMVGYEMLANPQRDMTAEFSAERLRNCSEIHYKHRK
ncbi:MAG: galactose-1-phosphate uridylyltransferase [Deltaproteobacteria bacterium RBG_19FT_COMBO_43_11]|nr:MAG: galactose-1-phosphate uridylyltransferase [Deltaproteobacteria bacterium RBG_19FT_COMBO_43_11]